MTCRPGGSRAAEKPIPPEQPEPVAILAPTNYAPAGYVKPSWPCSGATSALALRAIARRDFKCHQTRTDTAIETPIRETADNTRTAKRTLMITGL